MVDSMNKPVAWMYAVNGIWTAFSDELPPDDAYDEGTLTPLYTHPVKDKPHPKCDEACMYLCRMRELTDEEIIHIWNTCETDDEVEELVMKDFILFAKAILRKAQEK